MVTVQSIGHRVKWGHSFDDLPLIFDRFGLAGVKNYFVHLGKDFCTLHGLPIQFADEIRKTFNIKDDGFN